MDNKEKKYTYGIPCQFIINQNVENFSPFERGIATGMFGIPGLFATSGTKTQEVQVNGTIKLDSFNVILYSIETGEIRIPYSNILRCEKLSMLNLGLILYSGEKIKINPSELEIFDYIENKKNQY